MIIYRMDRLPFGDCCSPFVAAFATRKAAEDYGAGKEEAVRAIKENLYMDDYLDSSEVVVRRAEEVDDIFKQEDFHLTI